MKLVIFNDDCLTEEIDNLDVLTVGDLKRFLDKIPDSYQIAVEEDFVDLVIAYVTTDRNADGTDHVKMGYNPDDLLQS